MQTENKKGFQVKDLIVTALLSLCALVIYILCAFLSFSPYTMLVVSPLWSLLAAITYFLVAAKTSIHPLLIYIPFSDMHRRIHLVYINSLSFYNSNKYIFHCNIP